MELTECKLEFSLCEESDAAVPVIIIAAGSSSRMNGADKQFLMLDGIPVIARTLMAFENNPLISDIILVTREENIPKMQLIAERFAVRKLTDITVGGNSREESVLCGLRRVNKDCGSVLIHDGARPLVGSAVISGVVTALKTHPAVTCAVPVKDTIKRVGENKTVIETPDRSSLYAVQTPQGVHIKEYLFAAEKAGEALSGFTDDMSVMEAAGFPVHITDGSYKNIKITTPEDIILAQYMLGSETEE